jgi:hypothetical protein
MPSLRRHLLPMCCTVAFIFVAWTVLSLPIAAVSLIDNQFIFSDYLKFLLYAAGVGIGVSAVVMFPLSLFLERLTARSRLLVIATPLLLLFVSILCMVGQFLLPRQSSNTVFNWSGLLFALSLVFSFYWVVLHMGNTLFSFVKRFLRRTPS